MKLFNKQATPGQPKKSKKLKWLIIIAAVVIIGNLLRIEQNKVYDPPKKAAISFMTDLQNTDYAAAYNLMGPEYKASATEATFANTFRPITFNKKDSLGIGGYATWSHTGGSTTTRITVHSSGHNMALFMRQASPSTTWYVDNFVLF